MVPGLQESPVRAHLLTWTCQKNVIKKIIPAEGIVSQMHQQFIYRSKRQLACPLTIHTIIFNPIWSTIILKISLSLVYFMPHLSKVSQRAVSHSSSYRNSSLYLVLSVNDPALTHPKITHSPQLANAIWSNQSFWESYLIPNTQHYFSNSFLILISSIAKENNTS